MELDEKEDVLQGIMGNVPAELPQTSISGGYCAAAVFLEKAKNGTEGHSDCAAVVKDWKADLGERLKPNRVAGGILETLLPIRSNTSHTQNHQGKSAPGPRERG